MRRFWALAALYVMVLVVGVLGMVWLTRTAPGEWGAVTLAIAFPLVLLWCAAVLAREEAEAPRREPGPISVVGGPSIGPIRREPRRWTTSFAQMLACAVILGAQLVRSTGESLPLLVIVWWLMVAAFAGLVLPRVQRASELRAST